MSRGSRATQVKPEALVILFRANHKKPHLFAGDRKSASECAAFSGVFAGKSFYRALVWTGPDRAQAPARKTVLNLPCAERYRG
jgi:hypothetical protein